MISYNNSAPTAVNNVGQFGATEGSIGAYKSAAEYAADSKYWALLSQKNYDNMDEVLKEVERLFTEGKLLKEDIEALRLDFENQNQILMGLIQQTGEAIDNTNTAINNANAATDSANQAVLDVLAQLDKISNMSVVASTLPPGTPATGSFDSETGVFSFGIPEGLPGRDGTDGTISDIGDVAIGTPVSDDYGFFVDKADGGLYRTPMSEIAKLVPAVASFNGRVGQVVPAAGDYTVAQVTGAAASGVNDDISQIRGLTTALSVSQGGTGATTADSARANLGLGRFGSVGSETQMFSPSGSKKIIITNDIWGAYDITSSSYLPLGVAQGGTGAINTAGARSNLLVDRLDQSVPGDTRLNSSDGTKRLYLRDTGEWGCFDGTAGQIKPLAIAQGGTGATTAANARTNLGIGSVSVESIVPILKGGTGATTAASARTNLGLGLVATESIVPITKGGTGANSSEEARLALDSAKSGDNSDITSLSGLTTALSVSQGGTGATTVESARTSLSAAKSGANSDITSLSGMSPNLTLRGTNSTESHGNGVVYVSNHPVEASFGIANIGGGAAVFHNYAKPANGGGIGSGALIGGYGSRPWVGDTYTDHSNVSQHFLMDGTSSATNHGGWFRLLTTPLNATVDNRRQTFATSNNGDLYVGYDVPMGLYKFDVANYNGLDTLNGRGFKQVNNTSNEIALITPRNGSTANINFRGVAFNGTMTGSKGATQQGDNMWVSFTGHSGANFTGAAAGMRIQASSGWSTTNMQCGITFATTKSGSTERVDRWSFTSDGSLSPAQDNAYPIGSAASRVTTVFATNGAIQTSDARMKTEVRPMTDDEISASKAIAKEFGFFKWLQRVADEGDEARWHAGITVQRVMEIMKENNLDAMKYGIVCHDVWDEEVVISPDPDDEQKTIETIVAAGDRYSLRYSELSIFIARGLEQRLSELESKL